MQRNQHLNVLPLVPMAISGFRRVMEESSEMHQLWEDSEEMYDAWLEKNSTLLSDLEEILVKNV